MTKPVARSLSCNPPSRAARARRDGGPAAGRAASVALVALTLAACSNPFSPEGSEPGVYKGASDPLFEEPAAERGAALRERFELIQNR